MTKKQDRAETKTCTLCKKLKERFFTGGEMSNNDDIKRAQTGPMQFGDDWPGVFIRGDNALYYAMQLGMFLEHMPEDRKEKLGVFLMSSIENLRRELSSCFASGGTPSGTQLVKEFTESHVGTKEPKDG